MDTPQWRFRSRFDDAERKGPSMTVLLSRMREAVRSGSGTWGKVRPLFSDFNGVSWGVQAFYHPMLRRYSLSVSRNGMSAWGPSDAPEPCGPWTTVAYYDLRIDPTARCSYNFN